MPEPAQGWDGSTVALTECEHGRHLGIQLTRTVPHRGCSLDDLRVHRRVTGGHRSLVIGSGGWNFLDDGLGQWEAAYRRIRDVVRLLAPDGRPVPEFLLHIEGEDVWWRWSDEPFPEESGQRIAAARLPAAA